MEFKRSMFSLLMLAASLLWADVSWAAHSAPVSAPVAVAAKIQPKVTMTMGAGAPILDFSATAVGSGATVTSAPLTINLSARVGAETVRLEATGTDLTTPTPNTIPITRVSAVTAGWVTATGNIAMTATAGGALNTVTPLVLANGTGNGTSSRTLTFSMTENPLDPPDLVDYTSTITITFMNP